MEEVQDAVKLTTALEDDFTAIAASKGMTLQQLVSQEEKLNQEALQRGVLRCGPDASTMDAYIKSIRLKELLPQAGLPASFSRPSQPRCTCRRTTASSWARGADGRLLQW